MGRYVLNKKRIGMVLGALVLLVLLPYIISSFGKVKVDVKSLAWGRSHPSDQPS